MKKIALISYILLCSSNIFSHDIIGKVTNINNIPIEDVNISTKNGIGCSTDNQGNYILNLSKGNHIIIFQHVSFSKQDIRVKLSKGEKKTLNVILLEKSNMLPDVEIDLNDIKVNFPEGHSNKIELTDTVGILMRYPQFNLVRISTEGSETEYIFRMIKECINTVYDGDAVFERSDFTDKDLDTFLDSLTSDHFKQLQGFFETMPKLTHDVKFKNPKTKKQNKMTLEGMQSFFV